MSVRVWNRLAWGALALWGAFVLLEGRARRHERELEDELDGLEHDARARRNGHDAALERETHPAPEPRREVSEA